MTEWARPNAQPQPATRRSGVVSEPALPFDGLPSLRSRASRANGGLETRFLLSEDVASATDGVDQTAARLTSRGRGLKLVAQVPHVHLQHVGLRLEVDAP